MTGNRIYFAAVISISMACFLGIGNNKYQQTKAKDQRWAAYQAASNTMRSVEQEWTELKTKPEVDDARVQCRFSKRAEILARDLHQAMEAVEKDTENEPKLGGGISSDWNEWSEWQNNREIACEDAEHVVDEPSPPPAETPQRLQSDAEANLSIEPSELQRVRYRGMYVDEPASDSSISASGCLINRSSNDLVRDVYFNAKSNECSVRTDEWEGKTTVIRIFEATHIPFDREREALTARYGPASAEMPANEMSSLSNSVELTYGLLWRFPDRTVMSLSAQHDVNSVGGPAYAAIWVERQH